MNGGASTYEGNLRFFDGGVEGGGRTALARVVVIWVESISRPATSVGSTTPRKLKK